MSGLVIVGAQWGDEGKGKVVDVYTESADMVVRYAGGPNAGHTLVVDGVKIVMRLMPSGALRKHVTCVLAQGMVIDPKTLEDELRELTSRGLVEGREIWVSDRAHVIMPYHILVDTLREGQDAPIGTTKRGVGPCYEDKVSRVGIRLGDFSIPGRVEEKTRSAIAKWAPVIASLKGSVPDAVEIARDASKIVATFQEHVTDTATLVDKALRAKKRVVFEGAQGTLLDIDHGTYPFVTSSSAIAGGACTGVGVGPVHIQKVIGLAKAYTTRVGNGPFPTEIEGELGDRIRAVGGEFGSVTGRPRRVGWLDLVALRYAVRVNGMTGLALTKLDVLGGLSEVRIGVAYKTKTGVYRDSMPLEIHDVETEYKSFPGWGEDIANARKPSELPATAKAFLAFVEREIECPIVLAGVGQDRKATIELSTPV